MESVEQQQLETGLKINRALATSIQVFEWLSIVVLGWVFTSEYMEAAILNAPKFTMLLTCIHYFLIALILVIGSWVADFLKWTQLSALLNWLHLKDKKTALFFGGLFSFSAISFILIEQKMVLSIGEKKFSIAKDSSKYSDDKNYTLRLSEKSATELEFKEAKKRIEKSICTECLEIKAKYSKELNTWKRKNGKTDLDRKYINNNINSIEGKIYSEVKIANDAHNALIAKKIQQLEDSYNSETKEVKAALQSITNRVDSAKNKNDLDIINREKSINNWAKGTSFFTILLQLICRFFSFKGLQKLGRLNDKLFDENNPLLDLLQKIPYFGRYFEDELWQVFYENRKNKKQLNKAKYEMTTLHNIEMKKLSTSKYENFLKSNNYRDSIFTVLYFSIFVWRIDEYKNEHNIVILDEKISEKSEEMFEKVEETPIILHEETGESDESYYKSIIETFQMFYNEAKDGDEEKPYYLSIVETFKLFINDLKDTKI